METDPNKRYNLRHMQSACKIPERPLMDGWFGYRKNKKFFLKRWRKNCATYPGGKELDDFLSKNPDVKAYEIDKDEPLC